MIIKIQSLPNALTITRILLSLIIMVCLVFEKYRFAFYLFLLAGVSDGLDGFLARHYGWFSRFGSIADPLADKILLLLTLIVLSAAGHIPISLVQLVILRDIWVFSGAIAYHYLVGRYDLSPSLLSKANTGLQMLLVLLVLFHLSFTALPMVLIYTVIWLVLVANAASWIAYTCIWGKRAMQVIAVRRSL